jgi:hypothetical protein
MHPWKWGRVSSWPGAACGAAWSLNMGAAGAGAGAAGVVPKSRCSGSVKPRFTRGASCELERVAAPTAAAAGRGGSTSDGREGEDGLEVLWVLLVKGWPSA